jgi:ribosomal protein S18 acetylase RimI-like enzyme
MDQSIRIVRADLDDPRHARAIVEQLDDFARDPVGGESPLPPETRERLIPALREHGTSEILLAFRRDEVVGAAICFRGFSTFKAKPLINVHDLSVRKEERCRGVGLALLEAVEARARELGCCKLTLEVHEENVHARRLYDRFGFEELRVGEQARRTFFIEKPLGTR